MQVQQTPTCARRTTAHTERMHLAKTICLGATMSVALSCQGQRAATPGEDAPALSTDGAWCWFADPRAICGGPDQRLFAAWVTRAGDIQIGALDPGRRKPEVTTLHARLQHDDHDNPALLALPDGRLAAFYSRHGGSQMFRRTSAHPWDISTWAPERSIPVHVRNPPRKNITYPNPILLPEENNRLWLFWRGDDWKPNLTWSDDLGESFAPVRTLLARRGAGLGNRPYTKVSRGRNGRIHIAFTDGHPRKEKFNSIHYLVYERGAFHRANGDVIGKLADLSLDPDATDLVYDARTTGARAWIWDVAEDAGGHAIIVYTRLPTPSDHRYRYARWDGKTWEDHEVTPAGRWFPQTPTGKQEYENHYSGGIALDHDDPTQVYLSRQVNGTFEIEHWWTKDYGKSWQHEAVTRESKENNVRPFVPRNRGDRQPAVLWMHGPYVHYTRFQTSIRYH